MSKCVIIDQVSLINERAADNKEFICVLPGYLGFELFAEIRKKIGAPKINAILGKIS